LDCAEITALVTSVAICSSSCFICAWIWFNWIWERATFASAALVPIG
jgi:hypothetical protein